MLMCITHVRVSQGIMFLLQSPQGVTAFSCHSQFMIKMKGVVNYINVHYINVIVSVRPVVIGRFLWH